MSSDPFYCVVCGVELPREGEVCESHIAIRVHSAARAWEALEYIAKMSDMPDDWEPYDDVYGGYSDYVHDGREESVDQSNMGDVHQHGFETGRWSAAKYARAALVATPQEGATA